MSRIVTATVLGMREQGRRPLAIALLVIVPVFFITRAIARTQPVPRTIPLPGEGTVATTMRELHGADMAAITVAFLAGLAGVFVVQSLRQADRRLVIVGYRPREILVSRIVVLTAASLIVLAVSLSVTALSFSPADWIRFTAGTAATAAVAALTGALLGLLTSPLGATYLLLFWAMLDLGITQNPMFGSGSPPGWAALLPGWGPSRLVIDGAFSPGFGAQTAVLAGVAWMCTLGAGVTLAVRRVLGQRA